jgi:hypothetical protein
VEAPGQARRRALPGALDHAAGRRGSIGGDEAIPREGIASRAEKAAARLRIPFSRSGRFPSSPLIRSTAVRLSKEEERMAVEIARLRGPTAKSRHDFGAAMPHENTVLDGILQELPRRQLTELAKRLGSERGLRRLSSWDQLVAML